MTPHLNRLVETVQMRGHNVQFQCEIRKIIPQLSLNTPYYLELCLLFDVLSVFFSAMAKVFTTFRMVVMFICILFLLQTEIVF